MSEDHTLRAFVHDRTWSGPYWFKVEGEEDFDIDADRAVHRLTPALVARFRAAEDEMYAAANAVTAYLKATGQPRPWGMPDEDWNKAAELKEER